MASGTGSQNSSDIQNHFSLALLWRRLTVRSALLVGVVLFLTAVAIDSFHQAVAADMSQSASEISQMSLTTLGQSLSAQSEGESAAISGDPETPWTFNAEVAYRLRHSDPTRASLTRSHLTRSHLFAPH